MDNIDIESMLCFSKNTMKDIKIDDLRSLCYKYGLNKHGTKSELCVRIKSYLTAISNSNETLTINNIKNIKNMDDFIKLLSIKNIDEIHNLSATDINFLWINLDKNSLKVLYDNYKSKYTNYSDIDIKILSLVDFLSKQFCECYNNNTNEDRINQCKNSVLDNKNVRVSKFSCNSDNSGILLPKFGKKLILKKNNL
jgi:hypothetical protein